MSISFKISIVQFDSAKTQEEREKWLQDHRLKSNYYHIKGAINKDGLFEYRQHAKYGDILARVEVEPGIWLVSEKFIPRFKTHRPTMKGRKRDAKRQLLPLEPTLEQQMASMSINQ